MDFKIQHREDQNLIIATAHGIWNAAADDNMVSQIMQSANDYPDKKVLIDLRELQFNLPVIHFFERVQELRVKRRELDSKSVKVAIVYSPTNEKLDDDLKFFENTAINRGLPYKVFKDIEQATAWLMGNKN